MLLRKRVRWVSVVSVGLILLVACAQAGENGVITGTVTSTTLVDTVEGSGSVTPRHVVSLSWQVGGKVEAIYVQTGQKVKAGDILAALSADSLPPNILQARVELVEAQRHLEEVRLSKTAQAQAQVELANAKQALEEAKRNYYNVTGKRASAETIENAKAQYALAMQRVDEAQKRYDEYRALPDDNPLKAQAYSALYAAWQARDRALATLNWYLGKPSEIDVAKAEASLALAQAQLEDAQRKWERLKDGVDPNDIAAAEAAVQAAQNTVNSQYLIAPFDGEVIFINNEPGDVVEAGTLGIELIDRSKWYVTLQVIESKIHQVEVGDPATVTFETIPHEVFPGKVVAINPLGKVSQGVLYFDVRVQLDVDDPRILVGMTAEVSIQTSEPQAVLTVPAAAIQSDDQGEFVYVLHQDGSYTRVPVVSGRILEDDRVTVSGDLQEGDRVVVVSQQVKNQASDWRGGPGGGGLGMPGPVR